MREISTDHLRYILIPIAINALKHDAKLYPDVFKIPGHYFDLTEAIIAKMESDFRTLKQTPHIRNNVRKLSAKTYLIDGEKVEYTSEELRKLTEELVTEYAYGKYAIDLAELDEDKLRPAREARYSPPEVDFGMDE